ncbi:hypothetical protein [Streptomyces alkaliterrae]|uniref:Uncharacterized protein n=1 Tax=Streptomyces alkaliterrae TaxID=2213162 RepID=A0A7W3WGR8_9ACTN|nr:hypothetical protein [Streptomyces alkaliterrae]MBB1252021.1 hypothetical protein [Streptomyces alkaliterrae]MBB1257474.1 hypothetical protein [Streptomyces alkaliterrae]
MRRFVAGVIAAAAAITGLALVGPARAVEGEPPRSDVPVSADDCDRPAG